ncbi:MAG: response regulator [Burkholderiales bacterium]|nr:response regulator [Burkholderiales bacterium]
MSQRPHILITDDDPIMREMLDAVLSDDFDVSVAAGGNVCLQIANEQKIDLILMDVDMPTPDGYETCHYLKEDPSTAEIPVIFLSARSTIEERLKGYEAGGDDYIIKPYQPDELKAKISVLLVQASRQKELAGQVNDVMDAAMASANLYGEVGVVLDFMKQANLSPSYQGVADALFQALTRFEFDGCLRLRGHNGVISTTGPTPTSALEDSILNHVQTSGSSLGLQTLGTNTVFNYGNVMLLVRNLLPESHPSHIDQEEAQRHGRARDNIAMLAEAASARVKSIDAETKALGADQQQLLVDLTRDALLDLNAEQRVHREKIHMVLKDLVTDIDALLISLGLTEAQEEALLDAVHRSINQTMAIFDEGDKIEDRLHQVIAKLKGQS